MKSIPSDTWLRVAIPLALVISSIMAQGALFAPTAVERISGIARITFFIVLNFELGRYLTMRIQRIFPGLHQTKKRLLISYLAGVALSFLVITISTVVSRLQAEKSFSFANESLYNLVQCIWISLLIVIPNETYYSYLLLLRNEKEKIELQKMHLQNELSALREKINPHFLFNTLNTLSSMIIKDPQRAEEYIVELSSLYRFMLKTSNESLIALEEELSFLQSYLYLMNARFNDGLKINQAIPGERLSYLLPPLTLQMLIENAIKHNEISKERPLVISISVSDDHLTVSNNIQKKETIGFSSGTGLSAIVLRYKLLSQPEVTIADDSREFKVIIPLIKPKGYESIDH